MLRSALIVVAAVGLSTVSTLAHSNPLPGGACCFIGGVCEDLDAEGCEVLGGYYMGDFTVCDPDPCPPVGGCWFCFGECFVTTEEICISLGSEGAVYWYEDAACDPDPDPDYCPTACCLPDGSCLFTTVPGGCMDLGGEMLGGFVACDPNPCSVSGVEEDPFDRYLESTWGRIKRLYR